MASLLSDHIQAVIFDFDDTLVATIDAIWAVHKLVALKHFNKHLSDEDIKAHWGKPLTALIGLLHGEDNVDQAMSLIHGYRESFPKVIYEDAVEVLRSLRSSKRLVGIVTATSRPYLISDLRVAGIPMDLFDYIQTEDNSNFHKPDPRVFDPLKDWLSTKSVSAEQTVYIGDGLHDMKAAIGAGFEFIGVTTGLVTQKEFEAHNMKSISRLKDLLGD